VQDWLDAAAKEYNAMNDVTVPAKAIMRWKGDQNERAFRRAA